MFELQIKKDIDIDRVSEYKRKPKLIIDTKKKCSNIEASEFSFEKFSPLVGSLSLDDVKIINAGYLDYSHVLYKKAQDIFRELNQERIEHVVQDALIRLQSSWERHEIGRGEELGELLVTKPVLKKRSVDVIVDELRKGKDVRIVEAAKGHPHNRTLLYLLLHRLEQENVSVRVFTEEISSWFFKGNVKLFFDTAKLNNVELELTCSRKDVVPKRIKPYVKGHFLKVS